MIQAAIETKNVNGGFGVSGANYTLNNAPVLAHQSSLNPGVIKPLYQPGISSQKIPFLPPQPTPMTVPLIYHPVAYAQTSIAPFPTASKIDAPVTTLTPEDEDEVDVDELMALCAL